MFKRYIKIIIMIVLVLGLNLFNTSDASAATKVMWGKTELKLGQVGKITILKPTELVKLESNGSLTTVRALKIGEEFRVYSFKSQHGGLYGVGGGSFIQNSSRVKYETPSKSKLALLESKGTLDTITGKTFNLSVSQVESLESSKLLHKVKEDDLTLLTYEKEKYGYYSNLSYYFINGKMEYVVYDFLPDKDTYSTWNEMSVFHDRLQKKAVSEFGKSYFFNTDDLYTIFTKWEKDSVDILLYVDDKNVYTSAKLAYSKK